MASAGVAPLSVKRMPRGLTSVIEISGHCSAPVSFPSPAHEEFGIAQAAPRRSIPGFQDAEAVHETYYVVGVRDTQLEFNAKLRALTVQGSVGAKVAVLGGCVSAVSLHRCRELILRVDAPVSTIKLDDCTGVNIHLSWEAARGYRDDGSVLDAFSGTLFLSSGCHGVEVHCPEGPEEGAPISSQALPEMVRTLLASPASALESTVIDASCPWGQTRTLTRADVEAARRPRGDAGEDEPDAADPEPIL